MGPVFRQYKPAELYSGIKEHFNVSEKDKNNIPLIAFNLTGCGFLDIFVTNLYQHGFHTTGYHAEKLGVTPTEFCFTIQTLTGENFTDFSTEFIILMANDLAESNKDLKKIYRRLGFGSYSGLYRFMIRNGVLMLRKRR